MRKTRHARMNFFCLLSLIVISGGAVLAQSSPPSHTIVIFGDSITAGGALPKEQRDQLWVTLLEKEAAGALKLVNEGKGGRPTASLPDFDAMLKRRPKADALVIALGMNDSRDITSGCVPKAVANVRAMIEKARQTYGAGIPVLLVGPTNSISPRLVPPNLLATSVRQSCASLARHLKSLPPKQAAASPAFTTSCQMQACSKTECIRMAQAMLPSRRHSGAKFQRSRVCLSPCLDQHSVPVQSHQ